MVEKIDGLQTIESYLIEKKVPRRQFLKFCGFMAAVLAIPSSYTEVIAQALASSPRLPLVWLEFQDCTGDSESFLRAAPRTDPLSSNLTDPAITDLILDFISLDYHETLMAPSGAMAQKSLQDTIQNYPNGYICVVEGSIPTKMNGAYCIIHGHTALDILKQVSSHALATVAVGTCAVDGGLAAAYPNITGAVGVNKAAPAAPNLINLPGCPSNVVNVMACMVHYLTFQTWPDLTPDRRPFFAYGQRIHETCERRYYFDHEMFVEKWGDANHRSGYCLHEMGCKGPRTHSNCNQVRWNDGTNWPVSAGHGCVGCAEPGFWDKLTPVYKAGEDD